MRCALRFLLLAATAAVVAAPLAAQLLSGPEIPLYSRSSERGDMASLAAAPNGSFAVAWSPWSPPSSPLPKVVMARTFKADGAPLTATAVRISPDDGSGASDYLPMLAALSTGGYAAVWTRSRPPDVHYGLLRILDPTGHPAGPVIDLDSQTLNPDRVLPSSITADATGHFVAGWKAAEGAVVRRFDENGAPVTPAIVVTSLPREPLVAAFPDGRFVVGWRNKEDLVAQLFGPAGNALAPPFTLRSEGAFEFQISTAADRFVTIFATSRITGRLWDASGHPLGSEFVVTPSGPGGHPIWFSKVAMRGDGSFLVSWGSQPNKVRLFDPKGKPLGQPLDVWAHARLELEAVGNGWIIVWSAFPPPDLSCTGPWAQRLAAPCDGCSGGRFQ